MKHPTIDNVRRTMGPALVWMACAALAPAHATPTMADQPQTHLPRVRLQAGMHLIDAQVAQTPQSRQIGLMHRRSMPQPEGMLFVFEEAQVQCFWMKNTLIPLSAAFMREDGTIVNIADMQPLSEVTHCSKEPVRFVLEMNQGWFAQRRIQPGQRLSGKPLGPR
jgi:uncharacterized membrane protein (UPF0127 family)